MNSTKWVFPLTLLLGASISLNAQKADPVHFTFNIKSNTSKTAEVHLVANIDEGWHIYAQAQPEEAISVPTQITFAKNPLISVPSTKPKEIGDKEKYEDKTAGIVQYQYARKVEFVQPITVKGKAKTTLNGTVTYQVCTEEMCLPPKTIPFSIVVNN